MVVGKAADGAGGDCEEFRGNPGWNVTWDSCGYSPAFWFTMPGCWYCGSCIVC